MLSESTALPGLSGDLPLPAGVRAAHWVLHPALDEVRYAPDWKPWLGLDAPEREADSTRYWRSRVHPDDLAPMLGALQAHLEGWSSVYQARFRLRDGAGHYRPMVSRGEVARRDAAGRVTRLEGVVLDLAEPSHRPLGAAAGSVLPREPSVLLEAAPVGLLQERDGLVVWANTALCTLVGHDRAALVGLPLAGVFDTLGAHAPWAGPRQFEVQRRDGSARWVEVRLASVPTAGVSHLFAFVDIGELKAQHAQAEHLALHDALTGLPNRRLLRTRLEQALALAGRDGHGTAVGYLDLDGFKGVNDAHGHAVGDQLLQQIGQRLQAALRTQDTVARLGGDEFALVLTGLRDEHEGQALLQRVTAALGSGFECGPGRRLQVSASAGLVFHAAGAPAHADLLVHADRAMFAAKQARRGGRGSAPAAAQQVSAVGAAEAK